MPFNELLNFYIFVTLVLVFFDTCTKLYFSKKITFKHILECICFPVVISLMIISVLIKIISFIEKFIVSLIYLKRAQKFILETQDLSNEELVDYIYENCLKKDSLDIKFIDK